MGASRTLSGPFTALSAEGGIRPDVYVGLRKIANGLLFPPVRRQRRRTGGNNMKIRGGRSRGPVLKHGPNTASGGNARERAWERPISPPDWPDNHRKVQPARRGAPQTVADIARPVRGWHNGSRRRAIAENPAKSPSDGALKEECRNDDKKG